MGPCLNGADSATSYSGTKSAIAASNEEGSSTDEKTDDGEGGLSTALLIALAAGDCVLLLGLMACVVFAVRKKSDSGKDNARTRRAPVSTHSRGRVNSGRIPVNAARGGVPGTYDSVPQDRMPANTIEMNTMDVNPLMHNSLRKGGV